MRSVAAILLVLVVAFQAAGIAVHCDPCRDLPVAMACCSARDADDAPARLTAACCCAWHAPAEPRAPQGVAEPAQVAGPNGLVAAAAGIAKTPRPRPVLAAGLSASSAVPILHPPLFLLKHSYLI